MRGKKKESRDKDAGIADCFVLVVSPDHGLHSKRSARGGGHSASPILLFIQARPGFEANGVEVQLHVDVRMRQGLELRPRN